MSESEFARYVDEVKADVSRRGELIELLREGHPVYQERGAAAIVRMRGWVILAFRDIALPDAALLFVLEELDNGRDAYLVAAAARVLRNTTPRPEMTAFLHRAITNIRNHDDRVSFEQYGGYALTSSGTTAVQELQQTLRWLGPPAEDHDCCAWLSKLGSLQRWPKPSQRDSRREITFEDQDESRIAFPEFFDGRPSIVVFFYSRCMNPRKCSLTVANLARVQQLLEERGLAERIRTAAITYDPEFDVADRLRSYGVSRGLRMDANHRVLRAPDSMSLLCQHFKLGVNFVESIVNRHRVEVYLLDRTGEVAASFERIQWDEQTIVGEAAKLLEAPKPEVEATSTALAIGAALFPKCPMCWAAYLSAFGIASVQSLAYSKWIFAVLIALMLVNLVSLWKRGRMAALSFAAAGALAIFAFDAKLTGVMLTMIGSLVAVLPKSTVLSRNRALRLSSPARQS